MADPNIGPNPPWAELEFDTGCKVRWTEPSGDWNDGRNRTVTVIAANGKTVTVDQKTGDIIYS